MSSAQRRVSGFLNIEAQTLVYELLSDTGAMTLPTQARETGIGG